MTLTVPDEHLILTTPAAPWLPEGSTAEAWSGGDCTVPEPCIIVRLLLVRDTVDGVEFFCVPTFRGLDLPSRALAAEPAPMTTAEGLASLATSTYGSADGEHRCIGYIRNVVPTPDSAYPHPTPWAHVPVFQPVETVEPTCDGTWLRLSSARSDLSIRHWWPIVERRLTSPESS